MRMKCEASWRDTEFESFTGIKHDGLVPLPQPPQVIKSRKPPKTETGGKKRFKVIVSWYGELLAPIWSYAFSAEQMVMVVARRLAPRVQYIPRCSSLTRIGSA